jgi:integrase
MPSAVDQALVSRCCKQARCVGAEYGDSPVLSKAHQVHAATNPCAQPSVRELLSKAAGEATPKRGALAHKKPALTREPLEALLEICDASLTGLRDRALLLFAFASDGRRRSEVCVATMENTRRQRDGFAFTPSYSKTNQAGADRPETDKPIVGKAAHALTARLAAWKIKSAPSFGACAGAVSSENPSPLLRCGTS